MGAIASADRKQVGKVAAYLRDNPPRKMTLDFYTIPGTDRERDAEKYPELNDEHVLDFFFFGCVHDYGFWYSDAKGYVEPMVIETDSRKYKGSDFLWTCLKNELDKNRYFFEPGYLAEMKPAGLACCLGREYGMQWPDFDHRLALTRSWGQWLVSKDLTPAKIVELANRHEKPLKHFLEILRDSPFGWDRMMKKAVLLAMVLFNRPEKFLKVSDKDHWPAIVDYHLMRVSMRLGMVKVSPVLTKIIEDRCLVDEETGEEIREATRQAVEALTLLSGLSPADIDGALWSGRQYCPEMSEPNCAKCIFDPVCEKDTKMFQPVYRTYNY